GQAGAGVQVGFQPVTWSLPPPFFPGPATDRRSCPGLTQPIWRRWLGKPPVNTLRPMCLPRAAVKTASTLRRPTEQGTSIPSLDGAVQIPAGSLMTPRRKLIPAALIKVSPGAGASSDIFSYLEYAEMAPGPRSQGNPFQEAGSSSPRILVSGCFSALLSAESPTGWQVVSLEITQP
ncbi:hypothetical protein HPG69_009929, partial [Diceros bicornis minor]